MSTALSWTFFLTSTTLELNYLSILRYLGCSWFGFFFSLAPPLLSIHGRYVDSAFWRTDKELLCHRVQLLQVESLVMSLRRPIMSMWNFTKVTGIAHAYNLPARCTL